MLALGCAALAIRWERKQNSVLAVIGLVIAVGAVPLANTALHSYTIVDDATIRNAKTEVRLDDVREISITCQPHSNNDLGISIIAETSKGRIAIWKTGDASIPTSNPNFSHDMQALQQLITQRSIHVTNNAAFACASGLPVTTQAKDQFVTVTNIHSQ